jgi:hypothetical protein
MPNTRCKQGDLAYVIKSLVPTNLRKIVTVGGYVGHFQAMEGFEYNGIYCRVPITDHYWWIECPGGLDTFMGPMSRAVGPDTWLEPIRPDLLDDGEETGDQVYNIIPAETV